MKRIAADNEKRPDDLQEICNFWIHGVSGTGKSHEARTICNRDDIYSKDLSKWHDGYKKQPVMLIEDMDVYSREYTRCLKLWADKYAYPMEVKGGSGFARPKIVIVTSQYSIDKIWEADQESRDAINRRFISLEKVAREVPVLAPYADRIERCLNSGNELLPGGIVE